MDDRDVTSALLRRERAGLWRAAWLLTASRDRATDVVVAASTRLLRGEIPPTRIALWSAAFDEATRGHGVLVTVGEEASVVRLADHLASLTEPDVRLLLARHVGRFGADELAAFSTAVADAGNASVAIERAERLLDDVAGDPVAHQIVALNDAPVPPFVDPGVDETDPRRRSTIAFAGVVAAVVIGVSAAAVVDREPDPASSEAEAPSREPGDSLEVMPAPAPCRTDDMRRSVEPAPSALRGATGNSIVDVFESTDAVVTGRVRSLTTTDGWVTFDVAAGAVVDAPTPAASISGFSMRGRLTAELEPEVGLDVVAFVVDDPTSPSGWRSPVRGGVWVACRGGPAVPLGDAAPGDWVDEPTIAAIGGRVVETQLERRSVALARTDDRTVAGAVRLRDGTRLALRLPAAIEGATLVVDADGPDEVVLSGEGIRLVVDPRTAAVDVAGELARIDSASVEVYVIGREEPESGPIVRATADGGFAVLDASSLRTRWRLDESAEVLGSTDRTVVAGFRGDLVGLDLSDGHRRWTLAGMWGAEVTPAGSRWLVVDHRSGFPSMWSIDPGTGESAWRLDGSPGATWDAVAPLDDIAVLAERSPSGSDRLVAVDLEHGTAGWSVELGESRDGEAEFAVDADRSLVMAIDADDRLVRIDPADGAVRWRTMPIGGASISGIWPNTVTLSAADRTITVGLTAGFLLPP